ncbi:MAG: hypothetical protein IPJ34_27865 [Myxococcales bacterium]|nr:hypothetical protein [Myxococcales bacterium]
MQRLRASSTIPTPRWSTPSKQHDDGDDACALAAAIEPVLSSRGAAAAALTLPPKARPRHRFRPGSPAVQAAMQARARTLGALGRAEEGLPTCAVPSRAAPTRARCTSSSACYPAVHGALAEAKEAYSLPGGAARDERRRAPRGPALTTSAPLSTTSALPARPSRSTARPSPSSPRSAICACAGSPWATSRSPSPGARHALDEARAFFAEAVTHLEAYQDVRLLGVARQRGLLRSSESRARPSPAPTSKRAQARSPPPETAPLLGLVPGRAAALALRGGSATPTPGSARADRVLAKHDQLSHGGPGAPRDERRCAQREAFARAAPQSAIPSSASPPGAPRRPRPASRAAPSVASDDVRTALRLVTPRVEALARRCSRPS